MGYDYWPRFPALRGRVVPWLRQHGDTSEHTIEKIADRLIEYGYDGLAPKVADGPYLQAHVAGDGLTPYKTYQDVADVRDYLRSRGLVMIPVVVPRGPDVASWLDQAHVHAELARICGCLITDIEVGVQFIESDTPGIKGYTSSLRSLAGDAYLINQPDPRPWAVTTSLVKETAGNFDAIAAQDYIGWVAGGVNWTDIATEITRVHIFSGWFRDTYTTLYGVDRTDLALQFAAGVRDLVLGYNVFAFGPMNGTELRSFGQLLVDVAPEPFPGETPAPPPGPDVDWQAVAAAWEERYTRDLAEVRGWFVDDANGAQMRLDRVDTLVRGS